MLAIRSEEFEKSVLDDQKWADEFQSSGAATTPARDELTDTANHLLGMVNDPKFANSQVGISPMYIMLAAISLQTYFFMRDR